ncbi:hypothetical protein GOP47_0027910 [Adiantum capillus-veneris]|nr:hypothetical protein GOP47_0027910 [Adiantum capillus-veneris]
MFSTFASPGKVNFLMNLRVLRFIDKYFTFTSAASSSSFHSLESGHAPEMFSTFALLGKLNFLMYLRVFRSSNKYFTFTSAGCSSSFRSHESSNRFPLSTITLMSEDLRPAVNWGTPSCQQLC